MSNSNLSSPHVYDGSSENFQALVLDNSTMGPVLVNFWTVKAGPCLRQYPLLDKLVREYEGRFLLVNLNTDEQHAIAREYSVTSVPTLKLFRERQVGETRHGYQTENDLLSLLNRYMVRDSDLQLKQALEYYAQGATDRAFFLLAQTAMDDPSNLRLPEVMAKLLIREDRAEEAYKLLSILPEPARQQTEIAALLARLAFLRLVKESPPPEALEATLTTDPENLPARYQIAIHRILGKDVEGGLAGLLEIMRLDRGFGEDAGYHGLLSAFRMLKDEDELVTRYRALMQELLH
ncbi:MAG: tetratricopeptide repeat protein [Gammaproteobacteria bacterium]|nr:tetratricopeptide repeat protein [Gammaproteobacteria bacterium]